MTQENENEIEIQHRILIQEEEINVSNLPIEIRKKMREFNIKLEQYEKSESDELFSELQQDDISIGDDIVTWIEDEQSEEEEEDDSYIEKDEIVPIQPLKQNLEQTVIASLVKGVISVEILEGIIGREPDYPYEIVGQTKLKKQYMRPFYELAKS